ncbi:MAG: hypothetical protein MMC33_007104 [Icmadophila ericetorum]|nr:hypothetical protein [Icmadophila ericetorum]
MRSNIPDAVITQLLRGLKSWLHACSYRERLTLNPVLVKQSSLKVVSTGARDLGSGRIDQFETWTAQTTYEYPPQDYEPTAQHHRSIKEAFEGPETEYEIRTLHTSVGVLGDDSSMEGEYNRWKSDEQSYVIGT